MLNIRLSLAMSAVQLVTLSASKALVKMSTTKLASAGSSHITRQISGESASSTARAVLLKYRMDHGIVTRYTAAHIRLHCQDIAPSENSLAAANEAISLLRNN